MPKQSSAVLSNVVLTGACGGIGRELAAAFLAAGASVALVGRDETVLAELVAKAPDRARSYTPDVSDSAAMNLMAADWIAAFGVPDVVIANAGVASGFDTAISGDLAIMKRMLEINLLGVATTFQPFLDPMRARGTGTLVGMASIAGWRGMPGNGAYAASKGGLIRYLQSLRAELRPAGITVTTISPGYVKTPLIAGNTMHMPGIIEPEDAARPHPPPPAGIVGAGGCRPPHRGRHPRRAREGDGTETHRAHLARAQPASRPDPRPDNAPRATQTSGG